MGPPLFCFTTMGYKLIRGYAKGVQTYSINFGGTQMGGLLIFGYVSTKSLRIK
jgi:hypothetical protein